MANFERQPLTAAAAPAAHMSNLDSTPATVKAALEHAPPFSSPADSEKTVIATGCSTRTHPRLRRMNAQPGTGAAVLSTDGGRHPRRSPPFPPAPVIVRSDKSQGVFDFAGYWRQKCPELYHCFFPNAGWTITDLWDDADIHIESPGFLEDVLRVICHDNLVSVTKFARAWGPLNPEKLVKLAKHTDLMYDASDPFAIVDDIFTEGEQDECPRHFLYHAAWALRQGMQMYMTKRHAAQPVSSVRPMMKAEPLSPTIDARTTTVECNPEQAVFFRPRNPAQLSVPTTRSCTNIFAESVFPGSSFPVHGPAQSVPNGPVLRQPSFPQTQIQGPLPLVGDAIFMARHTSMIPGPFPGQPRHTKRRDRSGTNTYTQTPQMHGFVENGRVPSGEHPRHPSGPSMNISTHRYGPLMPGPFNPFPTGARLPSNPSVTSTPVYSNQVGHMQMMPGIAMFPPQGPLHPQLHDPAYQQYAHAPFMDMSNNIQHAPGRNADAHGMQRSNSQSIKGSGLFNPYGAERPDKAGFASTGPRKGGRGNFSNNAGRGRKYSAGTFDRSLYGSYPSDPPEHDMRGGGSQICEGPQVRQFSSTYELDPHVANDKQFGCSNDFIGPQNNTVRQLYVRNIPKDAQSPELRAAFLECTGVNPDSAQIKRNFNYREFTHGFVAFETVDEARYVLEASSAKSLKFRDRELQVSVARRYFHVPISSQQPRGASQEFRRPVESNGAAVKSVEYSPQDVRSDLRRVNNQQQQPDHSMTRGSPEARKAKKNLPPKKNHTAREDRQSEIAEDSHSPMNVALAFEAGDSKKQDESSSQDKKTDKIADTVNTAPIEELSGNVTEKGPTDTLKETPTNAIEASPVNAVDQATINATVMNTTEKHVAAKSELQQGHPQDSVQAVPKNISESIPANSQGCLLNSPTKAASQPPADQVEISNKEPNVISCPTEDSQVVNVAAVPLAQDETPSDDDQKNDLSFHSAQESQPDGDDVDAQKGHGTSATNIETELPSQAAPKDVQHTVQHHEAVGFQPCEEQNESELGVTVLQGPENEDIPTTSDLTEAAKKQVIKQIESLNPYSKSSRALQKKEKQAKKKEKSKEKKKRGKVEATSNTDTHAKDVSTEVDGGVQGINGTKKDPAQDKQSDERSGKQSRRISHVAPNQNLEAQQPMGVQESEVGLEQAGSPPIVQSHKKDDAQANGATAADPFIQLATPQKASKQAQELEMKPKKALSKIAVPHLEFLPPRWSPTRGATPPHTAYFSAISSTSEKADEVGTDDKVPQNQKIVEGMNFNLNDYKRF